MTPENREMHKMSLLIRKANQADFPAVLALITEFAIFQKTPEKLSNSLEQMTADKDTFQCLVAEVDAKIVGFASFFFAYYSWTGKALYLDDLYVAEAHRGQHIGSGLLTRVRELAIEQQCKKLRWQVSNWNTAAIQYYKKLGAVIDDIEINCDLDLTRDQPE